jgi:hypothetical protein
MDTSLIPSQEVTGDEVVNYKLTFSGQIVEMNHLVGKTIKLIHSGKIFCTHCKKQTKKSYSEGVCYPCSLRLSSCDLCILKPELCHYDKGTCREPKWGEEHCLKPHIIYLANSSGLKVGITRKANVPFRWMDQGASEALSIMEVKNRLTSGQVEVLFKKHISDKTDWRKMLKGGPAPIDLYEWREKLLGELKEELQGLDFTLLKETVVRFSYPVVQYPEKVNSMNLDKKPEITGKVFGIKGQYLILDSGVFNVRSHTGYEVSLEEIL